MANVETDVNPIELIVVTPERTVFEGRVEKVVLPTHDGYIGFLPGHYPLVCVVGTGELNYVTSGESFHLSVSGGFADVLPDKIRILADVAERATEIDLERAQRAYETAKERLAQRANSREDVTSAAGALRRALSRIRVAEKDKQ